MPTKYAQSELHKTFSNNVTKIVGLVDFFCDSKMLFNTLFLKGIHGWWPYLAAGVPYTLPPPKPPPPYSGG